VSGPDRYPHSLSASPGDEAPGGPCVDVRTVSPRRHGARRSRPIATHVSTIRRPMSPRPSSQLRAEDDHDRATASLHHVCIITYPPAQLADVGASHCSIRLATLVAMALSSVRGRTQRQTRRRRRGASILALDRLAHLPERCSLLPHRHHVTRDVEADASRRRVTSERHRAAGLERLDVAVAVALGQQTGARSPGFQHWRRETNLRLVASSADP